MSSLKVIVVEKTGALRNLTIKDFDLNGLYKKCGFKKSIDFTNHANWEVKYEGQTYTISLYAKNEGRHNNENKYEFPPPVDTTLYFGSCVLVASLHNSYTNLTDEMWLKMYSKLYGGFEHLLKTEEEDELEIDELDIISDKYKTQSGYLKDDFIVDTNSDDDCNYLVNLDPELIEESYVDSDSN
jgi:hypothetical protein